MAKAFEKVNPHWAVDVMLACGCPVWLVQYAMYLLQADVSSTKLVGNYYHQESYDKELTWDVPSPSLCSASRWTRFTGTE